MLLQMEKVLNASFIVCFSCFLYDASLLIRLEIKVKFLFANVIPEYH